MPSYAQRYNQQLSLCSDMCGFIGQTKTTCMRHGNYWCDLEWDTSAA